MPTKLTLDRFIRKCNFIYNDYYTYDKAIYTNQRAKGYRNMS